MDEIEPKAILYNGSNMISCCTSYILRVPSHKFQSLAQFFSGLCLAYWAQIWRGAKLASRFFLCTLPHKKIQLSCGRHGAAGLVEEDEEGLSSSLLSQVVGVDGTYYCMLCFQ